MTDNRQPAAENMTRQLAHDDEGQQRGDDALTTEKTLGTAAANAARRRQLLDKEIRAGWQRALGH